MNARPLRVAGRWVFPVEEPPIEQGLVEIAGTKIVAVRPRGTDPVDHDFGNAAIVPGFVNAHTHLELDRLGAGPATGPIDQIDWLKEMIPRRRGSPDATAPERNASLALRAGTTAVADISSFGTSWQALCGTPLRGTVYREILGLKRERALATSSASFAWLAHSQRDVWSAPAGAPSRLRAGLSPHAPYSTAGWLYERAAGAGVPLSTHLAELPEELDLLAERSGRLQSLLESFDAWDTEWQPLGTRPADYLRKGTSRAADWLIAHGTYLDPGDYWQLRPQAAHKGARVAVAYCPRSTAFFGHGPHPYRALLERGVVVCVGTDSLASADSLSVLDELRFIRQLDPSMPGDALLTMATLSGAWALRLDDQIGSLVPGKEADLAVVALPDRAQVDPHELLLQSNRPVIATVIAGTFVYRADVAAQG